MFSKNKKIELLTHTDYLIYTDNDILLELINVVKLIIILISIKSIPISAKSIQIIAIVTNQSIATNLISYFVYRMIILSFWSA